MYLCWRYEEESSFYIGSGSTGSIVVPNEMKQVIVIPKSATYEIQDKTYAWRIVDGKAESKIITILPTSDGKNYVVTSGLAVGDVIVSKGAGYVKEGQKVVDVPKINGNHVSSLAFR